MTAEANQEAADPNPDPYTRLHITPLDADLLSVVLSSSIRPRARNVSYHTLEAFPERRYGFVELPTSDADKIKQKLNGAVLKGVKIRIEQARPETMPVPLGDAAMAGEKAPKRERKPRDSDKLRKRKREGEEIPGVELEPGRKVKRGWTVPAEESRTRKVKEKREKRDKSDKSGKDKDKARKERREVKSKYTEHAECLVKSSVPNTTAPTAAVNDGDDGEAEGKKKRKKSKTKEVVIHEFEKTTKFPTFLKTAGPSSSARKPNLEFVDGKGWVDEEGTVVEAVKTRSTIAIASGTPAAISSDNKPSSDESEDEAPEEKDTAENSVQPTETSTPSAREKSKPITPIPAPPSFPTSDHPRPESSSSAKSLTIKIPPTTPTVHPLEALYKRPKQQQQQDANGSPAPAQQAEAEPFSFFGHADGSDEEMGEEEEDGEGATVQMPMTPFTRQDFESRGVRSAAPTPDTAHMNRTFRLWPRGEAGEGIEEGDEDEKEEDDDEPDEDDSRSVDGPSGATAAAGSKGQEATATGDFQEWFWNNRGDLNRSWKRRRKLVGKDKRYQENRARAERAI